MNLFTSNVSEKAVVDFVANNLRDKGASQYFAEDNLKHFCALVAEGKNIAAAKEFEIQTGSSLETCHFAVALAMSLKTS